MASDYSCPAGKRCFCKHVAALAYKLADCIMTRKENLPSTLTCAWIKQKWGLPSLRAEQDPEKEVMKRKPLRNIRSQRHNVNQHHSKSRKRRSTYDVNDGYSLKPMNEPMYDRGDFSQLANDLDNSASTSIVYLALKASESRRTSSASPTTMPVHLNRDRSNGLMQELVELPHQSSQSLLASQARKSITLCGKSLKKKSKKIKKFPQF